MAQVNPYWLPPGVDYQSLSEGIKTAVREILTPAYQQLVRQAPDELERAAGLSLVHLMWLEICDQSRLSRVVAESDPTMDILNEPAEKIAKHLQLVAAKSYIAQLLARLRVIRSTLQHDELKVLSTSVSTSPPPNRV